MLRILKHLQQLLSFQYHLHKHLMQFETDLVTEMLYQQK